MSEIKQIKTGLERFQAYRKAKGIPESATLLHAHKIMDFEEQERKELRSAYEVLQKENGLLKLALVSKCDLLKSYEAALASKQESPQELGQGDKNCIDN